MSLWASKTGNSGHTESVTRDRGRSGVFGQPVPRASAPRSRNFPEADFWPVSSGVHPSHNFRVARNPSRIDAKRGDHFLQADFTGLIPPWKPDSLRLADHLALCECGLRTCVT